MRYSHGLIRECESVSAYDLKTERIVINGIVNTERIKARADDRFKNFPIFFPIVSPKVILRVVSCIKLTITCVNFLS